MVSLSVDANSLLRRLEQMRKNTQTIPWPHIGRVVQESIKRNFDQGGRPDKWSPRKKSYPHPILKKTLALKRSISVRPYKHHVRIGPRGIKYAKYHHYGTKFMPARVFNMLQNEDIVEIENIIGDHIMGGHIKILK